MDTKDKNRLKRVTAFVLWAWLLPIYTTASNCAGTQPIPTPTVDAGSPYAAACANLASLGCADGTAPNCAAILGQMVSGRMTTVNLPCLTAAKDIPSAVACGAVLCK
jgi:hypothetical protein